VASRTSTLSRVMSDDPLASAFALIVSVKAVLAPGGTLPAPGLKAAAMFRSLPVVFASAIACAMFCGATPMKKLEPVNAAPFCAVVICRRVWSKRTSVCVPLVVAVGTSCLMSTVNVSPAFTVFVGGSMLSVASTTAADGACGDVVSASDSASVAIIAAPMMKYARCRRMARLLYALIGHGSEFRARIPRYDADCDHSPAM
jgi:hypothetical protein